MGAAEILADFLRTRDGCHGFDAATTATLANYDSFPAPQ
jgi:hypothetical protein